MFFSRNKGPKVREVMYMDEQACAAAVAQWLQEHPRGKAALWFSQDLDRFRQLLRSAGERVVLAQRLSFGHLLDSDILFVGHYPLRSVETALYADLGLKEILVFGHFDMPFMRMFGSERIKELMLKMGMQPGEAIEHNMISGSINNALDRISAKVATDISARSEAEWFAFMGEIDSQG